MKIFETGKQDAFWLVLALGIVLLAVGLFDLIKSRSKGLSVRPVGVGATLSGLAF